MKRDPRSTRDIHLAQQAAIPPADLQGDETTIIVKPRDADWKTVKGSWDPTCTNFNPHNPTPPDDYGALWLAWIEGDVLP